MTRPEGREGDTGLMWRGWQRSASEALMHSSHDDVASCVVVFAKEAIDSGREALKVARNQRQRDTTEKLLEAAHKIKNDAEAVLDAGGTVMTD